MSSSAKTVKFVSAHTKTVEASPASVWSIWSDVHKWHALDSANRKASINGPFAPGSIVTLGLQDGTSVEVKLTSVKENVEFADETVVPAGIVKTVHKMEQSGNNLIVTYWIEAEIAERDAQEFSTGMWQSLIESVPSQVSNVTALALVA